MQATRRVSRADEMTEQSDRKLIATGIVGTVIAALCCFTPVLVVLLGAVGLSAWLGWLDYVLLPALAWLGVIALLPAERVEPVGPLTQAQLQSDAEQRERLRMVSEVLLWPFGLSPAEAGNSATRRSLRDCLGDDAQLLGRNAT